jgi:hypothetical protein
MSQICSFKILFPNCNFVFLRKCLPKICIESDENLFFTRINYLKNCSRVSRVKKVYSNHWAVFEIEYLSDNEKDFVECF